MTILKIDGKIGGNVSSDLGVDIFINNLDVGFLTGKAVEYLAEIGAASHGLSEHESITNAIRYLVAELEENHGHNRDEWAESEVFRYLKNMGENSTS